MKLKNNTLNGINYTHTICSTNLNKTTSALNLRNASLKRNKSTTLVSLSAMENSKWTHRNLKALQTGQYPETPSKYESSLGSPATISISSKDIQKLPNHYWTSQRKPS